MKISIIIPTRERARYLASSLQTVLRIDDNDIEILVSDNASQDDTAKEVAAIDDPRLRYVNTGQRVSMRQNFEFALRQSTGDYVVTFGDDDGLIPGQFPVLRRLLESKHPDAVSWELPTYGWPLPGDGHKSGGVRLRRAGVFGVPERINAKTRLAQLERGMCDPEPPMPNLYHGCMSRAYLDRLAGPGAPYFRARSPDIYITFRALQHGGDLWHIAHPLSINGFSSASTGNSMQSIGSSKAQSADLRFLQEIKTDDVEDIMPPAMSMSLGYLGTLETARFLYPEDPVAPVYLPWYRRVLMDEAKKDLETAAMIRSLLEDHSRRFGAEAELEQALALGPPRRENIAKRLRRNVAKWHSFRRSAKIEGKNNITTAAQMCDTILHTDAQKVIAGEMSKDTAWRLACKRSKAFRTQV